MDNLGNFNSDTSGTPAVTASATRSNGVHGMTASNADSAVYGEHLGGGIGVFGRGGPKPGGGQGVFGQTDTDAAGVYGLNTAAGPGVVGQGTQGAGVVGIGQSAGEFRGNVMIFGTNVDQPDDLTPALSIVATQAQGLAVDVAGGDAVTGQALDGWGIVGLGGPGFPDGGAGLFFGDVHSGGNFTVGPGAHKSAAVLHPDGSHRLLYSMESPEMWFEDLGRGELNEGAASVDLDPDFAALVEVNSYQVFLTEYGDSEGLFVADQRPAGFTVRERRGGTSRTSFGYRVVAKRKDISRPRLQPVTLPSVPSLPENAR